MTTVTPTGRVVPKPVRREAAEVIRLLVAQIMAGRIDASPKVTAYLVGFADALDIR